MLSLLNTVLLVIIFVTQLIYEADTIMKRDRKQSYRHNWTTLLEKKNRYKIGLNQNIIIEQLGPSSQTSDIVLYGLTNEIIWQEDNALKPNQKRTFWCGPDVYKICIRQSASNADVPSTCNISY